MSGALESLSCRCMLSRSFAEEFHLGKEIPDMVGRTVSGRRLLDTILARAILAGIASLSVSSLCAAATRADASSFSLAATPTPTSSSNDTMDYGLLQSEMRSRGMGGDMLDNYGIRINGYAEAGLTYDWE